MTVVRSGGTALFTGTAVEVLEHTTHESVNVDHGAVHIDADDEDHVIRIKHDKSDGVDLLTAVDNTTAQTTMEIDSAGVVFTPNVKFGASFGSDLNVFATDVTEAVLDITAIEQAATALTTRVLNNELDINSNETNMVLNVQTLAAASHADDGATDNLVKRRQATGTAIDNLHVIASAANYQPGVAAPFPPPGLYFTQGTCIDSLDLLGQGQIGYQPYTAGGSPITSRTSRSGVRCPWSARRA